MTKRKAPEDLKPRGRPHGSVTKLTPEVAKAICADLELTIPIRHACASAGIRENLYQQWKAKAAEGEEPYASFMHDVLVAQSVAVRTLTKKALDGGKGAGNALWFLERRYPQDFPSIRRLEHSGVDGGPINIEVDNIGNLSDERLAELAASLNAKTGKKSDNDPSE